MGQELSPVRANLPTMQGAIITGIIPQTYEEAWAIAGAIHASGLAPYQLNSREKVVVVIMAGMELGMKPMASLNSFGVINGRPSLYGQAVPGLIKASNQQEWRKERFEGSIEAEDMVAYCEIKRVGDPEIYKGSFSVAQAKRAKLWMRKSQKGEDTPWVTYPERMLQWRARHLAMGDAFPDVLKGFPIYEEQQDIVSTSLEHQAPEPEPEPAPDPLSPRAGAEASTFPSAASEEVEATPFDEVTMLADLDIALAELASEEEILAMVATMTDNQPLSRDGQRIVEEMATRHMDRVAAPEPEPAPATDPLLRDAYIAGFMAKKGVTMPTSWASLDDPYPAAWLEGQQDRLDGKDSRYA